jgi:hypothetical protein
LFSVFYGIFREYRFEVAAFSINWLALVASGILLSIVFKRALATTLPKQIASRKEKAKLVNPA